LQLKYARNFTRDEIVDASVEEINRVNRLDDSTKSQYRKIFENIFPDVKEGDTIAAVYSPNKPLLFYYNDNRIGVINNTDLAHKFLDIWLGDQTRDPELRDNVLKLSLVDS
jgi:predicted transcriptional regulator